MTEERNSAQITPFRVEIGRRPAGSNAPNRNQPQIAVQICFGRAQRRSTFAPMKRVILVCFGFVAFACEKKAATEAPNTLVVADAAATPIVGAAAPNFTLNDTDGKPVRLADFKGKTVVLEWFNPDCPFVKMSHTKGSLKTLANEQTSKGVVWLAINSSAPGKQGSEVARNVERRREFAFTHPILFDGKGTVGQLYGATRTPQMYVINSSGVLVYAGAIDNSPDGEGEVPENGKLVNYVSQALGELASNKPVSVSTTKPYGCSVKYALQN